MKLYLPILLLTTVANAATYCVGPSASGNGSGADWSNQKAWTDTPARGDTWYLRSSDTTNYAAKTLAAALSGTTLITIKKATTNDHVTATGWSDWMGGQAVLYPTLRINTGYYVIDGGYRDESNPPYSWTNWTKYGILVTNRASLTGSDDQIWIVSPNYGSPATPANNVTVSNVFVKGVWGPFPDAVTHRYAVTTETGDNGTIHTGLLFSRMGIYGANQHWFLRQTDGAIVEYSSSTDCLSRSAGVCDCNHGENVNLYFTSDNAIIRYNYFFNNFNDDPGYSHGGTAVIALTQSSGCKIYGNIFDIFYCGNGVAGFSGGNAPNTLFYNNTIMRSVGGGGQSFIDFGTSGTVAYNNLWISNAVTASFTVATHDYNAFSDGTHSEANGQSGVGASFFVNYPSDMRLATNTVAGTTLSAPYNEDMLGTTRGIQGGWSRGAFQYFTNAPVVSTIGGNLIINGNFLIGQ